MVTQKKKRTIEHSLLFDLFKALDYFESYHKSDFFSPRRPTFFHLCATCSEVPFSISTTQYTRFTMTSLEDQKLRGKYAQYFL